MHIHTLNHTSCFGLSYFKLLRKSQFPIFVSPRSNTELKIKKVTLTKNFKINHKINPEIKYKRSKEVSYSPFCLLLSVALLHEPIGQFAASIAV